MGASLFAAGLGYGPDRYPPFVAVRGLLHIYPKANLGAALESALILWGTDMVSHLWYCCVLVCPLLQGPSTLNAPPTVRASG